MQSDKISLFNYLKARHASEDITFEQVLVVIHQNAVTLQEARRFLTEKGYSLDWKTLSKESFLNLIAQSYHFIINNRTLWLQQRKKYESDLLQFHDLYEQIAPKIQKSPIKSKEQILKELKDERTHTYAIATNTLNAENFSIFLQNLQAIVHFEKEAANYTQSSDYEANQLINHILDEISNLRLSKSIKISPQSKSMITVQPKKPKVNRGNLPKSHSMGLIKPQKSSKEYIVRNNSQKSNIFSQKRRNFIQEVRQQIKNQQIFKTASRQLSDSSQMSSNRLVSIHLPKILKLSDEEISKQGIYKSLKKFANFDYVAQEKKIRDIIGISLGEDEEYISAYFSKQLKVRLQKEQLELQNREERRKRLLQCLAKKQHHCRRFNPEEVQPYMRF